MTTETSQTRNRAVLEQSDDHAMPIWEGLGADHDCTFSGISDTNAGRANEAVADAIAAHLEAKMMGDGDA